MFYKWCEHKPTNIRGTTNSVVPRRCQLVYCNPINYITMNITHLNHRMHQVISQLIYLIPIKSH